MSNVNDYLKVMRKTGEKAAQTNPNSEFNQLKLELIEHYKTNKAKAEQLIKSVEVDGQSTQSAMHNLHYQAAVIAVRGHSMPEAKPTNMFGPPIDNQLSEMEKLKRAGWAPLGQPSLTNPGNSLKHQLIVEN